MSPNGDIVLSLFGDFVCEINMAIKNKTETKQKLIHAMGQILAEKGFSKIGVNAVARQAGVDKILIYRYFGDLNGLTKAYAESADFWPSIDELLAEDDLAGNKLSRPFADIYSDVFIRYAHAIRSRPLTLEILAWETVERNSLTIALEEVRESLGLEMMQRLSDVDVPTADWQAISNIFSASIHYLAIRARKIDTYSGMDLTSDDEWLRLTQTMTFIVNKIAG